MADSTYSIAIDAAFTDDSAAPKLDALTSSLVEAGKKSDAYGSAVRRLNSELQSARSASETANAALAVGADRYSELERDALRAAKAVETANSKGRLSDGLVAQALAARNALEKYSATLKPLEENAARAASAQKSLESQLGAVEKAASGADARNAIVNQRFEKMGQAVQLLPGPLRSLAQTFLQAARANQGLTSVLGSSAAVTALSVVAFLAVAAAVAYVTVKLVEGYAAFVAFAAVTADAARSASLSREAFAALDASTSAAASSFDRITDATGQTQAQLIDLTKQLRAAKVSAENMPAALRAAALAETALGKGGASEFIEQIKGGTLAVGAFAAQAQAKFGPIVGRQLLGLTSQSERFKRLWDGLFSDLNLEPVLGAIESLVSNLERGAPIAEFLRSAIGGLFGIISDNAQSAAFVVEAFFLGFAIESTKAYLAARPLLDALGIERPELGNALSVAAFAGRLLADVISGLVFSVGVVGAAFGALYDYITAPIFLAVEAAKFGIASLLEAFNVAPRLFEIGAQLMAGFANGILSAVSVVVDAVSGAVNSAIGAAKSLLGIASPSRVFAELGGYTAAGFSEGVEAGAPAAQGSMAAMVAPPAASGAPSSGAGGHKIDLSGASFVFHGVRDAENAAAKIGEALTAILRGDVESLRGAAV